MNYKKGDCLNITLPNNYHLAFFISGRNHTYYEVTLVDFYEQRPARAKDFLQARFFGTRMGSPSDMEYVVSMHIICTKVLNESPNLHVVTHLPLLADLQEGHLSACQDTFALLDCYLDEILLRTRETELAKLNSDLGFVGKHLIEMKYILMQ